MAINSLSTGFRPGVCTSGTRPTAPYEGQVIYETDTDLSYVWGGAAWQQVSGGTAVGNSGLVYITSVTIGTAVASVAVANCFSSTYDNYRIQVNNGIGSALQAIAMTMTGSTTGYYQTLAYWTYAGAATVLPVSNGAQWTYVGESGDSNTINMDIINPNLAKYTQFNGAYIGSVAGVTQGYHAVTTAYTGFTLSVAGTMTGGTVRVYGYRKA